MVHTLSSTSSEADPTEVEPESTQAQSQLQPGPADAAVTVKTKDDEDEEGQPPPLRSMSSFRARLRAGRRDASAPVSLFQWETRGHFWSALDKAAAPKDPSQARPGVSGMLARAWQRTKVRVKNTATVVQLRPSVLLWPLLLCAVCMAAGIVGVELGARHYNDLSKDDARAAASEALNSVDLAWWQSLGPLRSLELQALMTPAMAALGPRFANISQQLLKQVPPVLPALLLSPFGVARTAYSDPAYPTAGAVAAAVSSLLGQPLPALDPSVTPAQFQSLILQPYGDSSSLPPLPLLLVSQPVLVPGVTAADDWGNGPGPDGQPIASCSAPACFFAPADKGSSGGGGGGGGGGVGTRLWGFATGLVDFRAVVGQPDAGLRRLRELGYMYRVIPVSGGSASAASAPLVVVNSQPPIPSGAETVLVSAPLPGGGNGTVMRLEVYPEAGWRPYWQGPLLAVVVILSVAMSAMLFAARVLQYRHVMFLEAMLPKQVIDVLGSGRTFYRHFDMVTVLYADIVRYSNAPTGMPAWEIVKLLNDVNNMFDSLLDKHGLVKIRRSGEAFMAVGGCPDAGDPVSVAVRVAMCAREMVMATAGFRSSAGQRVQIRLGLHSGPAVAAVLGTQTPRFSLLGDTVDIAYFMESTSTIMGVHVSDTTAELLNIADDPLISLQPRGIIDIKGRGPITTSWLRIDLLAPMGTWNGEHAGGGAGGAGGSAAGGGKGGGSAGGGRGSQSGGKPAAAPADVACTADLAVAATLGVRGAPLVRKLSQTGLTQTRRALPDRRQREGNDLYDNSLLGSFTLRIEPGTIAMVQEMMARPTPPPSPSRAAAAAAADRTRGSASGGGGGSGSNAGGGDGNARSGGGNASGGGSAAAAADAGRDGGSDGGGVRGKGGLDAGVGGEAVAARMGCNEITEGAEPAAVAGSSSEGASAAGSSGGGGEGGVGAGGGAGGRGSEGTGSAAAGGARAGAAAAASLEIEVG